MTQYHYIRSDKRTLEYREDETSMGDEWGVEGRVILLLILSFLGKL